MKKLKLTKILSGYLKQHRKGIAVFLLFSAVFAAVFFLYRLETEAVLYSALLCLCIGLILAAIDFIGYYRRHIQMRKLRQKELVDLQRLPAPRSLSERDYTDLITALHDDRVRLITEYDSHKSEMIDYYTLWAHQIKTPIAAMRLLLQADDSEQNNELLAELFKTEQYVEMVLSYLRLGSNTTDYVIARYSLDEIVKQAVRKYAPLFIRKNIRLDFQPLECEVLTDEKWLAFVVEQLLSNALKYTVKGKISIYLRKNKTLVIEDTGIGIAEEDLPRICEKGFTGYNGRTDKKATGIGLYLCKQILARLSHTIVIESAVGRGTKVKIGLDSVEMMKE